MFKMYALCLIIGVNLLWVNSEFCSKGTVEQKTYTLYYIKDYPIEVFYLLEKQLLHKNADYILNGVYDEKEKGYVYVFPTHMIYERFKSQLPNIYVYSDRGRKFIFNETTILASNSSCNCSNYFCYDNTTKSPVYLKCTECKKNDLTPLYSGIVQEWKLQSETRFIELFNNQNTYVLYLIKRIIICNLIVWKTNNEYIYIYESDSDKIDNGDIISKYIKPSNKKFCEKQNETTNQEPATKNLLLILILSLIAILILKCFLSIITNYILLKSAGDCTAKQTAIRSLSQNLTYQKVFFNKLTSKSRLNEESQLKEQHHVGVLLEELNENVFYSNV